MINHNDLIEIPAPGEPLKPSVHPDNQQALESDVVARLELAKAKLSRGQLRSLNKRYWQLHRALNRAGYNRLIKQRDDLLSQYAMVKAAYQEKPTPKLKKEGLALSQRGKAFNAKIASLAPLALEFADVAGRLSAHEKVLALEKEESENRKAFFREAENWEEQIKAVSRQSPQLHHVDNTRKEPRTVIPRIQKIFIKPDKILFQIKTTSQNLIQRLLGKWDSALPYGVLVKDLTSDETLANLSAVCGRIVTVERSKVSQNIFYVINRLDSDDGIPNRVRYEQVLDYYPTERHSRTPYTGGLGLDRKVQHFDFEEFPHILIAGSSGGGKSNLINQMIATLISMNSPDELRLALVDNKGGIELSHFDGIPHQLMPLVMSTNDVQPALASINSIMRQRLAAFKSAGARNLESFNKKVKEPIPRIIVIIDEMATLVGLGDLTKDIHTELRTLSSQGRAVGIHLIICTQHPSVDVLPGWIKTNMNLRIASKMPNHVASQIIVDSISASILPDVPGRMVFRRGGYEMILQTPLIEDSGIARAVALAREYPAPRWKPFIKPSSSAENIPVIVKFDRDAFIKMALEQLDGKLSPFLVHGIIGNDVMGLNGLRKLHKKIQTEFDEKGFLEFNGNRYKLKREMNTFKLIPSEPLSEPVFELNGNGLNGSHGSHSTDGIEEFEGIENEPIVSLN